MKNQTLPLKYIFSLFILCTIAFPLSSISQGLIDFNWEWQMYEEGSFEKYPAKMPTTVQQTLINERVVPKPFKGMNEAEIQWVEEKNWVFETAPFEVSKDLMVRDSLLLILDGVDTYCEVFVNNSKVAELDNFFITHRVDIKKTIKEGENVLKLVFKSPIQKAKKKLSKLNYPIPGDGERAVTRKPQFHYGWDWGPRIVTMGIHKPIKMLAFSSARIKDIQISTTEVNQEQATLNLNFEVETTAPEILTCQWTVNCGKEEVFTRKREWKTDSTGTYNFNELIIIENPQLWYPHDMGDQPMYSITVNMQGASIQRKQTIRKSFGIRDIQLITEADESGESFYFLINGTRHFMKGANYIPVEFLPSLRTTEKQEKLLDNAIASNMNMLRVWGGGLYESEPFYKMCDEKGILIWQDFMFACSMYPGNQEFLDNCAREAEFQVKRLNHHPCIALWCGNNENSEGWERWGWKSDLKNKDITKLQQAYDDLFKTILPTKVSENTNIRYWESSPMLGRGDEDHVNRGDSHYWGVWHDAEPFEKFQERVPRFMSEFGFQSIPQKTSWNGAISAQEMYMFSDELKNHQKHPRGFELMTEYMNRWYNEATTLDDYIYLSQLTQARGIAMGIDAHRIAQPYCMGSLYWQMNDVWPSISWSGIDYNNEWKALQYWIKDSFEPRALAIQEINNELKIHLVQDEATKIEAGDYTLKVKVVDDKGMILQNDSMNISVSNEVSQLLATYKSQELAPGALLIASMQLNNDLVIERDQLLKLPKDIELQRPEITQLVSREPDGRFRIELESKNLALGVQLSSIFPGQWTDNYFNIVPGEKYIVHFTSDYKTGNIQLKTFSTYSIRE